MEIGAKELWEVLSPKAQELMQCFKELDKDCLDGELPEEWNPCMPNDPAECDLLRTAYGERDELREQLDEKVDELETAVSRLDDIRVTLDGPG